MSFKSLLFLIGILCVISCKKNAIPEVISISEELQITKINEYSYIHTSYLVFKGTKFPCNGFIYTNSKEAYIFDSPANKTATSELIEWLQNDMNITIKGVVFNHFHEDCTTGIDIYRKEKIPTIASKKTAELMLKDSLPEPNLLFSDITKLTLGNKVIINKFFGEAHTIDNITSYFPEEKILFGGCQIKSLDAKKGNLADANIKEWSNTVSKIKEAYPEVKIVIPGHGDYGNIDLLDYTISLFKTID